MALALSSLSDSDWAARAPTEQQLRFIGGVGAARRWQMSRSATMLHVRSAIMLDVPECYNAGCARAQTGLATPPTIVQLPTDPA